MFAKVAENESSSFVNFSISEEGYLCRLNLLEIYPRCIGLRYRSNGRLKAVRIFDNQFHLPIGKTWADHVFHCVLEDVIEEPLNLELGLGIKYELSIFDLRVTRLPPKVNDEEFYNYFSQFGKLTLCEVKRDGKSDNCRGYGFIRYANYEDHSVCVLRRHELGGCELSLRMPVSRVGTVDKMIFVSNITPSVTETNLIDYFSAFGKVTHMFMPWTRRRYAILRFAADFAIAKIFEFGECHRLFGGFVMVEQLKNSLVRRDKAALEDNGMDNRCSDYEEDHSCRSPLSRKRSPIIRPSPLVPLVKPTSITAMVQAKRSRLLQKPQVKLVQQCPQNNPEIDSSQWMQQPFANVHQGKLMESSQQFSIQGASEKTSMLYPQQSQMQYPQLHQSLPWQQSYSEFGQHMYSGFSQPPGITYPDYLQPYHQPTYQPTPQQPLPLPDLCKPPPTYSFPPQPIQQRLSPLSSNSSAQAFSPDMHCGGGLLSIPGQQKQLYDDMTMSQSAALVQSVTQQTIKALSLLQNPAVLETLIHLSTSLNPGPSPPVPTPTSVGQPGDFYTTANNRTEPSFPQWSDPEIFYS